MKNEKYQTIMPETDGRVLCVQVDKPISKVGYEQNFLPRLQNMLQEHGELRVLIYYKDYQGWEMEAAQNDMEAVLVYGKKVRKLALVNPPDREVFRREFKKPLISGELVVFKEEELSDAISWVKK